MEILDDRLSLIGGAIVGHDGLIVEVDVLHQDTLKGLCNEPLVIVRKHHNAELHAFIPTASC